MSYQLLSESTPIARKQYQCVWCPEKISKGEKHFHVVGKCDGDLQDDRYHSECRLAACKWFQGEDEFEPQMFKRGTCEEA